MARAILGVTAFLLGLGLAPLASASVYSDDLGKCMVKSSSDQDNDVLVQYIFNAIASNPAIKGKLGATKEQIDADNKNMAQLYNRLMLKDCRAQSLDALKYDGATGLVSGFEILGRAAMASLTHDPHVSASFNAFAPYLDTVAIKDLYKEAGVEGQLGEQK